MENQTTNKKEAIFFSEVKLSIRRKPNIEGLPGADVSLFNKKIGSALKGGVALSGLSFEEERQYLPEIIGVDPNDVSWRVAVQEYWNNISVRIPADGIAPDGVIITTNHKVEEFQGKPLSFKVSFKEEVHKNKLENASSFEEKREIIKKYGKVETNVADYVLFRYCLVYSKVANSFSLIGMSKKILFYLYSKENETKTKYNKLQVRRAASILFEKYLDKEPIIDAMLIRFEKDLSNYPTIEDKHLELDNLVATKPDAFLLYGKDSSLLIKAMVMQAAKHGILYNPDNTDAYYYGEDHSIVIGNSLNDAVLFFKSEKEKNKEIKAIVTSRLKEFT